MGPLQVKEQSSMKTLNQKLRQTLLDLRQADHDTRTRLVEEGALFEGYNEDMAAVHKHNRPHPVQSKTTSGVWHHFRLG